MRGKGGRARVVRIGHEAARALDRYLRVRSRHAQAWRPQLWLGVNNRGPMTANGIYQMIARRGRQAGVDAWTHRFRHHFSHTWLDRGGAEGVRHFHRARACRDHGPRDLLQELPIGACRVFGGELDIVASTPRARRTAATASSRTCWRVFLNLCFKWMSLVAMKV